MAMPTTRAVDRLERLQLCWLAVADLTAPETDLHAVDRDALAVLLGFIGDEMAEAIAQLTAALQDGTHKKPYDH